jgi:ribonuclease HI
MVLVEIFTDGACSNNGKPTARAGWGVYFGPDDPRNTSAKLSGVIQTNQRAELSALLAALTHIADGDDETVVVWSDSKYCVLGYNEWLAGWIQNGWMTSSGKPVKNQDLWKSVRLQQYKITTTHPGIVKVVWVKGHSCSAGNDEADRLAKAGIEK